MTLHLRSNNFLWYKITKILIKFHLLQNSPHLIVVAESAIFRRLLYKGITSLLLVLPTDDIYRSISISQFESKAFKNYTIASVISVKYSDIFYLAHLLEYSLQSLIILEKSFEKGIPNISISIFLNREMTYYHDILGFMNELGLLYEPPGWRGIPLRKQVLKQFCW